MYKFKKSEDRKKLEGAWICSIYDNNEYDWKVFGQLKTLFGEPLYLKENLEDQFTYVIEARDENGNSLFLNVYCGSSGPAIGGNMGELYESAAKELVTYICSAEVADYDYEGYYMDANIKVNQGVRSGVPYCNVSEMNLSEEEFNKLYNRLYEI